MPTVLQRQDEAGCRTAAVVVAHPDDEILWAGGTILARPHWSWFVGVLCRASDPDRAPKFARVLERLGATGRMADLDDGPEQRPLDDAEVRRAALEVLPRRGFDVVVTHGPAGEYVRHRRHEEVCRAVAALWAAGEIATGALWMFAFEDGGGRYPPRARSDADRAEPLSEEQWQEKYRLITQVYGFEPASWEAKATPRVEAFWCFDAPEAALAWINREGPQP